MSYIDLSLCGVPFEDRAAPVGKWPERSNYKNMIGRCYQPATNRFDRYGGRGISVCNRWLDSFENFIADMGPRPSPKHSIDRIDNDKGYEPSNCRWATRAEQVANRGPSVLTRRRESRESVLTCQVVAMAARGRFLLAAAHPKRGLGAQALRSWAHSAEKTGHDIAGAIGVTDVAYHEWITAGWFFGGKVPNPINRKKISDLTRGKVPESLFEDDAMRRAMVFAAQAVDEASTTIGGC